MTKKALTINNLLNTKLTRMKLSKPFFQAFGEPQDFGVWFIWGASGCGKSSFVMQLARELSAQYEVLHNSLEEDLDDAEFIDRLKMFNMQDRKGSYNAVQYNPEQLDSYLSGNNKYKHKALIIDSAHYFFQSFQQYRDFKAKWISDVKDKGKKRIIILTGSSDGKQPDTQMLKEIMRDAKMKILVSGYAAYCKGRTIGPNGGQYVIYDKGYEAIHGAKASEEKENGVHKQESS